jgi:hypothetical protein
MTIRWISQDLITELAGVLNPLGFSRRKATFSRGRGGYFELFHIEGSRWNSGEEPWVFNLDAAVRIVGIPTIPGSRGLWSEAHAVGNVSSILASAPAEFSVTQSSVDSKARELSDIIVATSNLLPQLLASVRRRALLGLISPLPVPHTWQEPGAI